MSTLAVILVLIVSVRAFAALEGTDAQGKDESRKQEFMTTSGKGYIFEGGQWYIPGTQPGTDFYLRSQCDSVALAKAQRTHQIPKATGFASLPEGGLISDQYYCATSCAEIVKEYKLYGRARTPTVTCRARAE